MVRSGKSSRLSRSCFKTQRGILSSQSFVLFHPKTLSNYQRRLSESDLTPDTVEEACADVEQDLRDICMFDVFITGDLEIAEVRL